MILKASMPFRNYRMMKFPQTLAAPFVTPFLSVAVSGLLIGFYINFHALQDALVNREYEKIK